MSENPLVSEIIVTHDRSGLLSETIESILQDRFEDCELLATRVSPVG